MADSSSAAEHRKKLRDKIRTKRDKRVGIDGDLEEGDRGSLQVHDVRLKDEISRRVEVELRKVFGDHPEAMQMAQQYINDPMAVLRNNDAVPSDLSADEKRVVDSLVKLSEGDEEDEAPPAT